MSMAVFAIVTESEHMGLYVSMCVTVHVFSVYHGEEQANSNCKGPEAKTCWLLATLHFYAWSQKELG